MAVSTVATPSGARRRPKKRHVVSDSFYREVIQAVRTDCLFMPRRLEEVVDVRLKPGFPTACWTYLPPHKVYIGTGLFDKEDLPETLTREQKEKYIANHLHHELGHGLFTERDMKLIKRYLADLSCPFPLYNLFEDAYMEEAYRRETGYQFDWLSIERLSFEGQSPAALLFAFIQAEGDVKRVAQAVVHWPDENDRARHLGWLDKVEGYYRRIVAATKSTDLMPILRDWLAEFPQDKQPPSDTSGQAGQSGQSGQAGQAGDSGQQGQPGQPGNGGDPRFGSELELSAALQEDEALAVAFDEDSEPAQAPAEGDKGGEASKKDKAGKYSGGKIDVAVTSNGDVLLDERDEPCELDETRAAAVAAQMARVLEAKVRTVSVSRPQKKISARHLATDRPPYRRKELIGQARKNIFLVIDCSGSMQGKPSHEARILVYALSLLAQRGLVEGHVALSIVHGWESTYETFELPLSKETCKRIEGYGHGEGLEGTMQANARLMREADLCFVFTDAFITDQPVNREHYRKQGILTWGLYAGDESDRCQQALLTHFDKAIMRGSIEKVIDAILLQL